MPETNEWLFDIIWELSDKSYEAGLPELAGKLEEAMDTYLLESQMVARRPFAFQRSRDFKKGARDRTVAKFTSQRERRKALKAEQFFQQAKSEHPTVPSNWHNVESRFSQMLA